MSYRWRPVNEAETRQRIADLGVEPADVLGVETRDEIGLVRLRGDRLAFVAVSQAGRQRLVRERAVLAALRGRVPFGVPDVVRVSDDGVADLRRAVVGTILSVDELFAGLARERERSRTLGRGIGELIAALHRAVEPEALADVVLDRVSWPEPTSWILERLPDVVDDPGLHRAIADALATFDAFMPPLSDRVLVHTDVGLHNLALDRDSWAIHGIFDFGEAALGDRHWDLRHLCWPHDRLATLHHTIDAYEAATGVALDRDRALLYNAATAFSYLAFRRGVAPEARWCGRTLAEDLAWTRWALANVSRPPAFHSR
jgi:aminoglycoside phosphotransferase